MKTMLNKTLRRSAGLVLAGACLAMNAAAFVHEMETEFHASGDFDGDGRLDVAIVDRASGAYRVGHQLSAGVFTWTDPRASGVENVTGLSVGKILDPAKDALAFASPNANRVNVLAADDPSFAAAPVNVFFKGIGPELVIALDVGGAGNTVHDDFHIASVWNGAASPFVASLTRNTGAAQSSLLNAVLPARVRSGNAVLLKSGGIEFAAVVAEGVSDILRINDLSAGTFAVETEATGLEPDTLYFADVFGAGSLATFVVYLPGKTGFAAYPVTEPAPGTFKFGTPKSFDLGAEMYRVFSVSGGAETQLLVLFDNGESAAAYDFDGANAPVLIQDWDAPSGSPFTGASSFGNGNFSLYNGSNGISSNFQDWKFDGSKFQPGSSGGLPGLALTASTANVFLFQAEPFVSANPVLVQSLNAADWSANPTIGGTPKTIKVDVESFVDSESGLDNPVTREVSTALASANFGLVNQYMEPISIQSFSAAIGNEVTEVKIAPQAGTKKTSITVSFTAQPLPAEIYYRLSDANDWTLYGSPFPVFKTTTVSYFAKPPGSDQKSAVKHATYVFAEGPDDLDSDEDGVPDYVEIGKGLDPLAGDDSDGDGYSDKTELIKGTDPSDPTSVPPAGSRLEEQSGFDLALTLRPFDGTTPGETLSEPGAIVRAYDLQGSLYTTASTANLGFVGVDDPAALLANIAVDEKQRLVVAATEPHFDIATSGTDKRLGREMLKLVPVPDVDALDVPYEYGGGTLASETANWIADAQAADAATVRALVAGAMTVADTLVALLVEKLVEQLLTDRGLPAEDDITLFSFRPADSERLGVSRNDLLALEMRVDGTTPGVRIREMFEAIAVGVDLEATAEVQALVALVEDVYRISSALNNASPGTYKSPVDTIRTFLNTGVLDTAYGAETSLTAGELTGAAEGCAQLLALVGARPTDTFTLYVMPSSFGTTCTTLETMFGDQKSLFFANGSAYHFPESFQLVAGSEVQVFAYTDFGVSSCGGDGLEVISVDLTAIPAPSIHDSDGDLMSDDFECTFLGGLDADPFGDEDGDGISNLQESFDHTDPNDALAAAAEPVNLSPPAMELGVSDDGTTITLSWPWPAEYAGMVDFIVIVTEDLGLTFIEIPVTPIMTGDGAFEVVLPLDIAQQFFAFKMQLR